MINPKVKIIGGGLIGGSISLALTKAKIDHSVEDLDSTATENLKEKGDLQTELSNNEIELVFLALPPNLLPVQIESAFSKYPNAVVCDVGSVKESFEKIVREIDHLKRYVGTHPMAGKETSGSKSADPNLFADRVWVLCPNDSNDDAIEMVRTLITEFGAMPVLMKAAEHDEVVALLSHLPQVLSSTLAKIAVESGKDLNIAGPSFRDMTRVANSDFDLWSQILLANSVNISKDLKLLIDNLNGLNSALKEQDAARVVDFLRKSQASAKTLPGKHGGRANAFDSISLRVSDEPGSLAKLFILAQKINLNIEDVYIEHVLNRPLAVVTLFIKPEDVQRARARYSIEGWELRE